MREGEGAPPACADPSDIHRGDWVERYLPAAVRPYARLARLDRPIGTWLLLFPGWWGIALASERWPDPVLLLLFVLGAVTMRGAGCTLNDIADRHYDGQVARTRLRPLPSRTGQQAVTRPPPLTVDVVTADRLGVRAAARMMRTGSSGWS